MTSRQRTFVVLFALLGGTAGLILSMARDTYCIGGGGPGRPGFDAVFACPYKWLFGWDVAPILADAVWTAIGLLVGGLVGYVGARASHRT